MATARLTVESPKGDPTLSVVSGLRLGLAGARCYGRTSLAEGESAFIALSWGESAPTTQDQADEDLDIHRALTGGTGWPRGRSPITRGVRTSSAAPSP